jgi:hypothetical protein
VTYCVSLRFFRRFDAEKLKGALMLDNPEKTARLLAALKAAVPFEVDLTGAPSKSAPADGA